MNHGSNRKAAGLRRSAIAERIRLREEWSALKEIDCQPARSNVIPKAQPKVKASKKNIQNENTPVYVPTGRLNRQVNTRVATDALRGVVALVEVGSESRALPLRAALTALGASVMPAWSPLITHLVWAQGGCRSTRARARALASCLVSPLWVEACASSSARLSERAFPAPTRPSDLPSPATLRRLLKKAEAENLPLGDLLDSNENNKPLRLRISSDTEDTSRDTSKDTSHDTSKDTTHDTSNDTSKDTSKETTTDIESRVNTAPRRALAKLSDTVNSVPAKSRRKLFTQKEADTAKTSDKEDENSQQIRPNIRKPNKPVRSKQKLRVDRKELARAERMAKRLVNACTGATPKRARSERVPRIVLTGMSREERREATAAILSLKGRVQRRVNKRTTHVVLGSMQLDRDQPEITGIANLSPHDLLVVHRSEKQGRTVSALAGAARGCRVMAAKWLQESRRHSAWQHHAGHEVPHLARLAQKARLERLALAKPNSDYAYDVFCGMRVYVSPSAEQRDAAIELLDLCGAVVQNGEIQDGGIQNGGLQNGERLTQLDKLGNTQKRHLTQRTQLATVTKNGEIRYEFQSGNGNGNGYDIKIGTENGDVSSKWVFDSVAAARMRTTRRYVVNVSNDIASQVLDSMANFNLNNNCY